jgi:hypothetical protein
MLATSLTSTYAGCDNGEIRRCGYPSYGHCIMGIAGTCPTVCEGAVCFPDNDCIISVHQGCSFTCCTYTDRPGCEWCAESSGLVPKAMCDAVDCQYQLSDLGKVKDTLKYVLPVITHGYVRSGFYWKLEV